MDFSYDFDWSDLMVWTPPGYQLWKGIGQGRTMPKTSVVGLGTAKTVFQIQGVDGSGKVTLRKRPRRGQLTDFFANPPVCIIELAATQGAHYSARVLATLGHTVRLIAPQFVGPYLKSQKNDANDAAAICEAISQPQMRLVPGKTAEQL